MTNSKIGIIGAGRLGTALGRAFTKAGYEVSIINSKGADSLALQLQILLPGVTARNIDNLVDWADVIVLAVPLPRFKQLPVAAMNGKIVIDAMNYWSPVDGKQPEFDAYAGSSSELVAEHIPGASVVKAFNTVAYGEIDELVLETDPAKRRAIPIAGNDDSAKQTVTNLAKAIGFEVVDIGNLASGINFQPDSDLFNRRLYKKDIISQIN